MNWDDKGFLISKFKYNENSVIAEFYTHNHGKISGIIYGASSKKIKGYLQVGNLFQINCNLKNDSKLGSIKVEIIKPLTPFYFSSRKKLHSITSAMSMIRLLTAENQINENIYFHMNDFFEVLQENEWLRKYLFWELNLLKLTGYDLNLDKIVTSQKSGSEINYFVENFKEKKFVPAFLVDKTISNLKQGDLIKGYNLISNYIEKNILIPNNLNHPLARLNFISLLK